jgi:hypothetical protein
MKRNENGHPMTKPLQERVAEYLALDGKRTPGEWTTSVGAIWGRCPLLDESKTNTEMVVSTVWECDGEAHDYDVAFIVASANLAPSIIREQQEEIDRLREAISEFLEAFDRQSPKPRVSITAQAKKVALRRALTAPTITQTPQSGQKDR